MPGVRAEQRERTRQVLVERSRGLFATRGYADVGLAEIVTTAGVTKGALYHHFPDGKSSLFAAVLAQVQDEVGDAVAAAARAEPDGWAALLAGCRQFLVSSTAVGVSRIMLVDGPAVLGWATWRELDDAASGSHLAEALEELVRDGVIVARPAPLARLLSGAMNEAALWLAARHDDPDLLEQTWTELAALLTGLRH